MHERAGAGRVHLLETFALILGAGTSSTLVITGLPSTPIRCTDTPTHTSPARTTSSAVLTHSGFASTPPLTLSHSTTTVPLSAAGFAGARTSTRVR
jgi:hypothetical protein